MKEKKENCLSSLAQSATTVINLSYFLRCFQYLNIGAGVFPHKSSSHTSLTVSLTAANPAWPAQLMTVCPAFSFSTTSFLPAAWSSLTTKLLSECKTHWNFYQVHDSKQRERESERKRIRLREQHRDVRGLELTDSRNLWLHSYCKLMSSERSVKKDTIMQSHSALVKSAQSSVTTQQLSVFVTTLKVT